MERMRTLHDHDVAQFPDIPKDSGARSKVPQNTFSKVDENHDRFCFRAECRQRTLLEAGAVLFSTVRKGVVEEWVVAQVDESSEGPRGSIYTESPVYFYALN